MTKEIIKLAERGQVDGILAYISEKSDINAPGFWGATLLHEAAWDNMCRAVELLLSLGADPNARTRGGATPLHWAAMTGSGELIKLLMSKGARLDCLDNDGNSALHWAAKRKNSSAARALITAGISLSIENTSNRTAAECFGYKFFIERCLDKDNREDALVKLIDYNWRIIEHIENIDRETLAIAMLKAGSVGELPEINRYIKKMAGSA